MSYAFQFEKYYDSHSYSQTLFSPSWCDREKSWDIQGFNIRVEKTLVGAFNFYTCIILFIVIEMLEILKYNCKV